ncbi:hypothetical protein MCOR06_003768 [Pyricularia oryzae]|nr:hypothetical protein MCOR06_003768 [Pyricularia oryzae]
MSANSNGPIRSPQSSDPDGKSSSAAPTSRREFRSQLEAIANTPSPVNRTSEWVSGIDDASGQHSASYMERLCRGVRSLFLEVLQNLLREKQEPEEVVNSVCRSYETIVIWDDDFGASSGGLDETFQKSPEIRNLTAEIMREVAEILIGDLMDSARFMESHGFNWDENYDRHLPPPPRNPRDILEKTKSLTAATECLSSLAPLYEEPPVQFVPYETERLASEVDVYNSQRGQAFKDQIHERLPDVNDAVASKLAQANVSRLTRLIRTRQDNNRKNCKGATNIASPGHDSDQGASFNADSCAETLMSFTQWDSQARRVPRLSKEAQAGIPFICWLCGLEVTIKDDRTWKHHIVTDLKPYICIAPSCYGERVVPFENCQSWESHLLAKHSDDWKLESCPLCRQETAGRDRPAITKHIRHHLKEIALASMPIGTDPGLDDGSQQDGVSDEDDATPLSCPFRKRNPQRFNVDRWPSCALGSFENILMLKYKIFRLLFELHSEFVCKRCQTSFRDSKSLEAHLNRSRSGKCEEVVENPEDGVNREKADKLDPLDKAPQVKDWKAVWHTLFPADKDVPPCAFVPPVRSFSSSSSEW